MSDILNRIIKADNQMVGANPAFVANTYLQDPAKLEGLYNTVLQSAMGDLQFRTDYEQLGDKEKQAKKDRYIKRAQEELGRYRVLSGASKNESLITSLPEMQDEELVNWAERYNTETKSTLQTEPGSFGAETKQLLQKYRVESFEKEISKGHNAGHIPNDVYAMAFDIYDKFGSEGLTEFINYATKGGKVASTQFDMGAFTEKLVQQESGGRADARNKGVDGKNTAAGLYQFVDSTLAGYVKRIKPDVIGSDAEIAEKFRGTEVEDAAFRLMTTDNIGILKAKGLPVTELNVYFAHFFGPGDATKVLQASDETPIESVIRANSYKQNPQLHGKTIAEVKEFYAKKFDNKEPLKVDEEADYGILNNDILASAESFAKSVRFNPIKLKDKELYNRDYNEFTSQFYETGNINEFLKSKVDLSIDGKVPKFGDPNTYVSPREAFYAAGYDEDDYRAKLVQLHRNAVNSPEQSGLQDLIRTVFANHSGVVNDGAVIIDEKNMSFPGKMALEVLRNGGSSEKMFYRDEDNRLVFEPGRVQRLSELATKTFSVTKKVPNVVNGTWDGTFNEVRDDSWLNFPMDVWYGLRKFNTTTATALMETVFDMENMDSKLIRSEYEKMRDVLDSEADAGALPFMVGYMIPAIVTAKLTGGVALSAAATVTRGAAGIRSAVALNNAVRFGANLNSGGRLADLANKLGVMATRTAPQMFAGAPIALTAPDPMADDIGAMLVSAGVSEEFAEQLGKGLGGGTGIVGGAIAGYRYGGLPGAAVGGAIGGLVGAPTGEYLVKENREAIAKTGAALEDWYYASDAFTRTAVSIIAEDVLLGSVIDNIFGGIRYAKHARLVKDGKFTEVPGLKYKGYGDEFEAIKDATEFKGTDYIFRELREELAVLNNKEFMAEANLGRAIKDYVGTVNRASRKTGQIYNIDAVDEELTLLRQQIKDTIENNDKRFGVETQNLDTRTEKIYSDVMSRLAKDIDTSFSLVKYEGAGDFVNELVTTGNGMKVQEFNTYRDALTAKKGKKDTYIVTIENKHLLYELSDNTWRKDLLRNLSERFKNPARVKEERLNAIYRKLGITETSHPDVAFKLMEDIDNIKIGDDISEYKKMKDAYDAKKKAEDAAKAAADKQAEQAARQAEQDAKLAAEKTKLDELNAKLAKEAELKAEIDRKHKEAKEALEAASTDLNSGETGFIQKVVELNRAADAAMGKKVKKGKATLAEKIEVALDAGVGSWGDLKGIAKDGEVVVYNPKYRGKHKGRVYIVKGVDGPEFYYGNIDAPKTEPGTKIIDKDTGLEMDNPEWTRININEGYDIATNTLDKGTAQRVKAIVEAKAADETLEVKAGEKIEETGTNKKSFKPNEELIAELKSTNEALERIKKEIKLTKNKENQFELELIAENLEARISEITNRIEAEKQDYENPITLVIKDTDSDNVIRLKEEGQTIKNEIDTIYNKDEITESDYSKIDDLHDELLLIKNKIRKEIASPQEPKPDYIQKAEELKIEVKKRENKAKKVAKKIEEEPTSKVVTEAIAEVKPRLPEEVKLSEQQVKPEEPQKTEFPIIKDAEAHAKAKAGVPYMVGENYGLVQGFNMFGKPIYAAFKDGKITRVDIDTFTGELFSKTELEELKQKKVQLENLEAEKEGNPFKDKNVAGTDSVSKETLGFVESIRKLLGIDTDIFIIRQSDLTQEQFEKHGLYGKYGAIRSAQLGAGTDFGSTRFNQGGNYNYIYLRDGLSPKQELVVLSHELGHVIEKTSYFKNANKATKDAIRAEYQKWYSELTGKTLKEVTDETRPVDVADLIQPPNREFSATHDHYISSFSEWFADNVAKWITSQQTPKTEIEKFFSGIADKLTDIYNYLTGNKYYSKSVFDWLDEMVGKKPDYIQKAGFDKESIINLAKIVGAGAIATEVVESIQEYLSGEENPTSTINQAFIVGALALGTKVGPNAPKFKQQMNGALTLAKQMERQGKNIDEIASKTGWSKNPLGQWHTSILDQLQFKPGEHKLKVIGKNSVQFKLGDVADGKIFELYPDLKELKVRIEGKKKSGSRGAFVQKDWAIDLYSFKGKPGEQISDVSDINRYFMTEEETDLHIAEVKETLYHEIQHAIQKLEGFPTGSNYKKAKESWEGYKNTLRNDSAIERKVWANEFQSTFSKHGTEFGKFGKMLYDMFMRGGPEEIKSSKEGIRDLFEVWIEREYLGEGANPKAIKFAVDTLTPKLNSILDSIDESFFTELQAVKKYEDIAELELPTKLIYHNTYGEYQARVAGSAAVSEEAKIATKNENWTEYGNLAQFLHEKNFYQSPLAKPFIDNFGGAEYNPLLATAGIASAAIITEEMLDEETQKVQEAGIGSGIGKLLTSMAAGVETGYKTAIGTFRSRKAKLGDDIVDDIALAKNLVLEKQARENLVFDVHGLITPKSEVEKTRLKEQVLNKFNDLVQKGGWFENQYMQTAYNFLVKVSPEQGRRIAEFFRGSELSVARQTALVRNMYHSTAKEFGVDLPYEKIETEVAPQIIRGVVDEINSASGVTANVSEEGIRKQFGEAFFRIMESTTGENPAAVKQMYEAGRAGQIYQMIDQRLMQDESFRTYIEAHRRAYANINDEAVTLLNEAIGNEIKSLMIPDRMLKVGKEKYKLEEAINLLELYRNSYLNGKAITSKEFEDSLPAKDLLIWKRMKKVDDVKNVIKKVGLRNSLYNNRAGNYVPQMLSRKAIDESKARFVRDANLIGLKAEEVDKLWMEQVFIPQFLDINEKKTRGYGKKLTYSAGGGVTEKIFKTSNRAYSEFKREFDALPQDVQRQVTEYIGGPMSEAKLKELGFIKENEKIATTADGKPVILASGNSKKVKEYTLNLPEDFKVDYDGKEFDIFKESNRAQLELLQNDLISHLNALYRGEVVRNSKFLENPRNYELPYFVRETNPDAVWRIYSYDTGTRLHFLRKGIWDEADLNRELIDPLTRDVHSKVGDNSEAATANIGRIINVYRLMTDSARDLHAEADPAGALRQRKKAQKLAGLFTGWEFMKRGFGFTQFDALDALSRGAVFTSYDARDKAVKYYWRNQKSQQVMERLLADMGLIREQFRYLQPEFTTIDPAFGGDAGLNTIEKWMDKGMNMVSDFSPINVLNKTWNKMTGSNTMWNDAGAHRLIPMVGSLNNMSRMNTGTMAYMFLAEANEMAKAFTQIEEGAEFAFVNGRQLSRRDIIDKMTMLGVTEERIPNFIADNIKFQEFLSTITESPETARDFFSENPEFFRDIQDIFTTATQTYNGSSKLFRPEAWHSPWGRILSMYMNFDTNTGFQVLKRRIVDPIKEWQDNHNVNGELGFFSIAADIKAGKYHKLRQAGMSDEAIEQFPIEAVNTMGRAIGHIGLTTMYLTSLDLMKQMMSYPFATEEEQSKMWEEWKTKQVTLNPRAPEKYRVTIVDAFDSEDVFRDSMRMLLFATAKVAQSGVTGVYGSTVGNIERAIDQGPMTLFPATSIAQRQFTDFGKTLISPIDYQDGNVPHAVGQLILNNTPVVSGSYFSYIRNTVLDKIKPEKKRNIKVNFGDGRTGTANDIFSVQGDMYEFDFD